MKTVTGLFKSPEAATDAVQCLQRHGVSPTDISVVARDDFNRDGIKPEPHSKAPEGFAVGAAGGGAMGGLLVGLGVATGTAGLGLVVAGPIAAVLMGIGAGASAGSIVGGMVGAAIPEKEANDYETAIQGGSVLIGVQVHEPQTKKDLKAWLEEAGAERIATG